MLYASVLPKYRTRNRQPLSLELLQVTDDEDRPMFWKEIDAFIPEPLAAAVEAAYGVFARYTLSGVIVHCDCPVCMTAETAQALSKRPRMEATGSSISVMPPTEIGPGMMRTAEAG